METNDLVDAATACPLNPATDEEWSVVIAYGDAPAARRAVHTLGHVVHGVGGKPKLCLSLWRFDILENPDWRAEAAIPALLADLLIIAASNKTDLPVAVQDWVQACFRQKQGHAAAVVALLGPADDADAPDSPRVQVLRNAAEAAGLGFFAPTPPGALPPPARPAPRVLLVEDDRAIRQASARVLLRAGYQVNEAGNCETAWETLQSSPYDLLITDNQMPGMSGLELVRKLRAAHLALPVVIASGGMGTEQLNENPWLQPAAVLPKPFTGGALVETVAVVLARLVRGAHPGHDLPVSVDAYSHWGLNE